MPLPKVKYPTYFLTVPSTGEEVKYRPYNVREEKILLTANENPDSAMEIVNAIKDVVSACCFGKLDPEKLTIFDLDFIFLKLRSKSVNEIATINFRNQRCTLNDNKPCDKTVQILVNLDEVTVQQKQDGEFRDYKIDKRTKNGEKIIIEDDLGVTFRYPNTQDVKELENYKTEAEQFYTLLTLCITSVFDKETVYTDFTREEMVDWFNDLLSTQKDMIKEKFENMPRVRIEKEFHCKTCGHKEPIGIEGTKNFFQ